MRRDLTLILPYYDNPGMLAEQQRIWSAYPADLKDALNVIVVDDGSPTTPARAVMGPTGLASFRLYRTLVDVRWNWLFCRNLGADKATTEWILLTDIDHVLPAETLRVILDSRFDFSPSCAYRFSRVDAPDLTPYKPHPNTWLMTRALYQRIGGYDERFSGYYGTDADFRERVQQHASAVVLRAEPLIRYPRSVLADASTRADQYGRKELQDRQHVPRIRAERSLIQNWRPLNLTFPWAFVAEERNGRIVEAQC